MEVLDALRLNGLIPVMKFQNTADAVPACKAVCAGGLNVAEITFRTDAAEEAIRSVCRELPDMLVGAGTVTSTEQAKRARDAGARFIVTPGLSPRVVEWCVAEKMPIVPGVNDPSGIEAAMGFGLDCVKFFPAEASGGVKFLKAIHAPYSAMRFVPTGGVSEDNLADYLSTPGVIACGGSWMVPADAIARGEFDTVRTLVRGAIHKMLNFRLAHIGVNTADADTALATAERLQSMFGFTPKLGNSSVMAGQAIELVKGAGRGANGHIGIATSSVERAIYFLERAGFPCDRSSQKTDAKGGLKAIYLAADIAGFAIHLVQC